MKFQFRLRTMLLVFVILAIACAIGTPYLFPKQPAVLIKDRKHWDEVTKSNNCVLFVYGPWHPESVYSLKAFEEFAKNCYSDFDAIAIAILYSNEDLENENSDKLRICNELWDLNKIEPWGMKNYGGSHRTVWLKDGKAVKFSLHLPYVNDRTLSHDELVEHFRTQTKEAFK